MKWRNSSEYVPKTCISVSKMIFVFRLMVSGGFNIGPSNSQHIMVELESVLVPKLNNHVKRCRPFVDDTFVYIKGVSIENVLSVINSFHGNITFTDEQDNWLPFLHVLFMRDYEKKKTPPSLGEIHTMIFLHIVSHFNQLSGNKGH